MTGSARSIDRSSRPHIAAVALACATFPLIWVGGLVTTYDAGMAVQDWPTTYGYNLFLYPWQSWIFGPWDLFIEHGHRLLGALVGLLTIALNGLVWRYDARRWMRWLALAALVLVIAQGVLGGLRVRLASTELARIHGCVGPLFFAVTLILCSVTSRFWVQGTQESGTTKAAVISAWTFFALAYLQLIVGSHLRHPEVYWSPSLFQTLVVFHVVLAVALLMKSVAVARSSRALPQVLKRPATLLVALVTAQVVLGVAAWRAKYGWPSFLPMLPESQLDGSAEIAVHRTLAGGTVAAESMSQALTVTSHVAVGSLILAASVSYAIRLSRSYWSKQVSHSTPSSASMTTTCMALPTVFLGGSTP